MAKVEALRQGPPGELGSVDVGAIIFPPQLELIDAHVRDAVDRGAELRTGGRVGAGPGRFYEPTVLTGVDHSMLCMTEETFGPTLPVMRVADAEEAVALANEGSYGLQASVWTRDTVRGEEIARRIEAGVACVNDAQLNYAALELPMGGWKQSGLGSRHGADGIRKYTRRQSLLVTPGYAPAREVHMFPYVGEVTAQVSEALSAYAASELFDDAQRATLAALCDTWVPSLDAARTGEDPTGFWARSASDYWCRWRSSWRCCSRRRRPSSSPGSRDLLDALAAEGMAAAAPQEAREAIVDGVHGRPRGGGRARRPPRRLPVAALRAAGRRHRDQPELARDRLSRAAGAAEAGRGGRAADRSDRPGRAAPGPEADAVVVGSGAGGGVIAGELAAAGKQVCVLEMGGYHDESEFNGLELWAYQHLFLNGGPFATAEGQVSIQAGSALGGGTVLNWTNCLRTTDHVRSEWAASTGSRASTGPTTTPTWTPSGSGSASPPNAATSTGRTSCSRRAARPAASTSAAITRNTDPATYDPVTAGYLGFGDQSGSKRSTAKTYLADAAARGADFLVHCRVERILVENGRAAGVEAIYLDPDGRTAAVTVQAPTVVVACGSIESPALLLRSRHRRRRPSATTCACIRRASSSATTRRRRTRGGVRRRPRLSHEFADLEDGYGFLIECAQHTTGLTAAALPWRSGRDHKEGMAKYPRGAGFINLTRDRGHGRVTIDGGGRPVLHYPITRRARHRPPPPRHRRDGPDHGRRAASRRCRR